MRTCNLCGRELNTTDKGSTDCGGDCLRCMATIADDPQCAAELNTPMTEYSVVKVKALVEHVTVGSAKPFTKLEERYVRVPTYMIDDALREKKSTQTLPLYVLMYNRGLLEEHNRLCKYIETKVGRFDWCDIERITIL